MSATDATSIQPRRTPTQARSRQRVDRILAAALDLLAEGPADGVTAAAIARRAGMPIGSFYQYFPNRLAVLAEVSRRSLAQVDRVAIEVLEATRDRPWTEAVDRVVDAHLEALRSSSRAARMLRDLAPSREFVDLDAESNARFARALASHPALEACGPPEVRHRIARVAVEAAGAVEATVLRAESPEEGAALAHEMKRLLRAYLALSIETPSEESSDSAAPR